MILIQFNLKLKILGTYMPIPSLMNYNILQPKGSTVYHYGNVSFDRELRFLGPRSMETVAIAFSMDISTILKLS